MAARFVPTPTFLETITAAGRKPVELDYCATAANTVTVTPSNQKRTARRDG